MVGLRLFASLSCLSMPKPMLAMHSSVPPYVSLHNPCRSATAAAKSISL